MEPHPCLVELAQAGSASLRAGLVNVSSQERDFLESWCRDTMANYASATNTPALSRTPSSLIGLHSASVSGSGLASPPLDTLVMSPGPNGGCKDLLQSIPLEAVLYELELLVTERKSSTLPISHVFDRPSTPLSFASVTSSSGTISSFSTPVHAIPSAFFQPHTSASLSPMQQMIINGPRHTRLSEIRTSGRARAGSFAVRGVV